MSLTSVFNYSHGAGSNSAFRRWLFIVLAILQLVSPLLHAHATSSEPVAGLHVPGLEQYVFPDEVTPSDSLTDHADDRLIIIDFGLHGSSASHSHDVAPALTSSYVFHVYAYTTVFRCQNNLPAQTRRSHSAFLTPQSPRAPPNFL